MNMSAAGRIEIDARRKRFAFRPDPKDKWGQKISQGRLSLGHKHTRAASRRSAATSCCTPTTCAAAARSRRCEPAPTRELAFAVVGSLTDDSEAKALAERYARPVADMAMRASGERFWGSLTRGLRIASRFADAEAFDTIIPVADA